MTRLEPNLTEITKSLNEDAELLLKSVLPSSTIELGEEGKELRSYDEITHFLRTQKLGSI